jgi:mono/diheme cytochrome c family protein
VVVKRWILLGFVLAACDRGAAGGSTDGVQVYLSVCATCHGGEGKPPEAMSARLGVRDLTSSELRARVTPALVEAQVRTGSKNKLMPAFEGALTDAQIKAVAEYVASKSFPR